MTRGSRARAAILAILLASAAIPTLACGKSGAVRVGSKNFTEQVVLGELAAQALEAEGVRVERRLDLGGTFVCHEALVAGRLDLYPEYTGTAFTAVLKEAPVSDPPRVREAVAREYAKRWNLTWLAPLGFDNTFALVMRGADARRAGIARISDVASHPELTPGFGYEFVERADGWKGLAAAYGLAFTARPREMDLGLLYAALSQRQVDVVAGNATDGLIAAMDLAVLEDDRRYFPPYEAAYVVRAAVLEDARVRRALGRLSGAITPDAMRRMNAEVDRDRRAPADVARRFLASLPAR